MINEFNYAEIFEIAKILKEKGIHYFRLKTDISSKMLLNEEQNRIVEFQLNKIRNELEDGYFKVVEIHKLGDEQEKIRNFDKCFIHYLYGAISADGNVYPCNYHPQKGAAFYDSAINKDFSNIWENLFKYDLDKKIPVVCPNRCDPFKNRANRLLNQAYKIYKENGIEKLKKYIYNN